MTKCELRVYGGITTLFGLFVVFPYFLPLMGCSAPHLHENPVVVGALDVMLLFIGGYEFGRAHGEKVKD